MNALLLVPPASPVLAVQNGAAKLKPSPFEEASVSRQCCRFNQACEAIANRQNFRRNFARFLADKLQEDNQLDSSDSRALVHTIASGQHLTVPALKDYVRTPGAERSYKYEREKIHLRQCPFCGYLIHLLREIENENLQNDFGRKLQLRLPVLRRHAGQAITHREVHRAFCLHEAEATAKRWALREQFVFRELRGNKALLEEKKGGLEVTWLLPNGYIKRKFRSLQDGDELEVKAVPPKHPGIWQFGPKTFTHSGLFFYFVSIRHTVL